MLYFQLHVTSRKSKKISTSNKSQSFIIEKISSRSIQETAEINPRQNLVPHGNLQVFRPLV